MPDGLLCAVQIRRRRREKPKKGFGQAQASNGLDFDMKLFVALCHVYSFVGRYKISSFVLCLVRWLSRVLCATYTFLADM